MASERCKNCSRYIVDQIDDSIPKYYKDIHIKNNPDLISVLYLDTSVINDPLRSQSPRL